MTMPDVWTLLSTPIVDLLGWTLLHFVGQGALLSTTAGSVRAWLRAALPGVVLAWGLGVMVLAGRWPCGGRGPSTFASRPAASATRRGAGGTGRGDEGTRAAGRARDPAVRNGGRLTASFEEGTS